MTMAEQAEEPAAWCEGDLIGELFHSISQPLTALECGLEISLRQDREAAQLRARMKAALASTQTLHQRLLELRLLLDAGEPGNTTVPVALDDLLFRLRDDFASLAHHREIGLWVRCKPAWVRGNAARLRSGFFHLFEYLLGCSLPQHVVCVVGKPIDQHSFLVRFGVRAKARASHLVAAPAFNRTDLGLRIALRTFQAAGGELVLKLNSSGNAVGQVCLQLANRQVGAVAQ
ncbi:MAG TPA: hypothetical protein VMU45_03330 [Candidatus Eisenbacteria bacterium]|nr:hypothetical protein [Candidatus Eisenbacteria bacterium]